MNSKNIVNKKKLIIIFHDMTLGGIQRKVIDIISNIQTKYPNIKIVLYLQNKKGIFLDKVPKNIEIKSPKIHTKKFNMVWFTLWLTLKFIKEKPTHILSFMDLGAIPTLVALKLVFFIKTKVIIGEDILTSKYVFTETRPLLRLKLIKYFYPQADVILVQTLIQKKDLEKIIGKKNKNIKVSPNWLPLDFPPKNIHKKKDIDILFLGRIEAQKNLIKFVNIVKIISKEFKNVKAVIVGDGTEKKKIKELIKKLDLQKNIKILPPTTKPTGFYQRAKIFLLTSDYEGFPLTLLESISCGCYPVVNNISEVIKFFDKNKKEILFKNEIEASKIIKNRLWLKNPKIIEYYKNKTVELQQENIQTFMKNLF